MSRLVDRVLGYIFVEQDTQFLRHDIHTIHCIQAYSQLIADNKIYLFLVIFVISSCQKYTFIMRPILLTLDFGIRLRFVL